MVSSFLSALIVQVKATPLAVISTTPANNSTNVPLKTFPMIVFSDPVNPTTLSGSVNGMPIVPVQATFDGLYQTLKIDLGEREYEKTYTVVISGNLEDSVGNKMGSDYTFSFTTAARVSKRPTSTINVPANVEPGKTYAITGEAIGYVWQRDADNPLELRHWDEYGTDTGDRPMLHPTVLYFPSGVDGYKFYLFYTPYPGESDENPCLMRSNDGKNFEAVGVTNPLFKYNTQPVYDSKNLADPEAIKVGDTWMVFYEMEQAFEDYYAHLGVAFSSDGINYGVYGGAYDPPKSMLPWPTNGNPVVYLSNETSYEYDGNPSSHPLLAEPAVIFKDGLFQMWYVSINPDARVVYATASDPRGPWTKYGPVFDYARHVDVVYDPERDLYVMLHLPGSNSGQIYVETSSSPEGPWTSHPDNPVFSAQGGWEGPSLYRPALVEVGTQWYMYYSANPGSDGMIGLAKEVPGVRRAEISTNGGLSWAQLSVNPDGTWGYSWTPPTRGIYSIQVRVTDDWMRGDPAEAIASVGFPAEAANPILVIVNASKGSFGEYTGEILKAEGFNEFQMANISQVTPSFMASFDTVILTMMSLSPSEATMFQDYVFAGGNLVAFRPDGKLASLFGLTSAGTTTSEGYIKVDDTTDVGKGITNETMQFHGTADQYNLNGASPIAMLFSDAATQTQYPAVTTYNIGYGNTVFFAFDFPKSIALLRQGNPANANKDLDGVSGIMPSDLFVNWVNVRKIPIPQADEQMRLLSNAIMRISYYKTPLPRLWYFPNSEKTMLIWTGDQDWGSTAQIYQELDEIEARGAKMSLYLTNWESTSDVNNWASRGHEVGWHLVSASNYDTMNNDYTSNFNQFDSTYEYYPTTIRHHCVVWFDWVGPAPIEQSHGIRMDFNYYHIGEGFLNPGDGWKNGWMSGSGLPMRFVDENGTIYNVYQVMTELGDEMQVGRQGYTPAEATAIAALLLNESRDGFYSAFCANFHPVTWSGDKRLYGLGLLDKAYSYGIPIWSGIEFLNFTDARDKATFEDITYSGGHLDFVLNMPDTANLTIMIPYEHEGRTLNEMTLNSTVYPFTVETIKGIKYAFTNVSSAGIYEAAVTYGPDTAPPEITIIDPPNGTVLPANTTSVTITVTTNEYAECKYSTNPDFDYAAEGTDFTYGQGTLRHSFIFSGLHMNRTYDFYYKASDTAGNINTESAHHSFSVALEDITPPEWSNQQQSKSYVKPGDSVVLSAKGKDDYGLSYAVLSTNETGTWKNITWFDTSWAQRKPITLTEHSGSDLTQYQVKLSVSYVTSKMKSDFSDMRFTANDGLSLIPFWIESYTPSSSATVWVKVPSIPASGSATIYMYYGNPSAASASNGTATFEFFDDFSGSTLNSNKWNENAVNTITDTVSNYFRFEDATKSPPPIVPEPYWVYDGTDTGSQHQAKWTPPSQFVIEWKSAISDTSADQMGQALVGVVAPDNTVIGAAGHQDWMGVESMPERGIVTESVASSLGSGVSGLTGFPYYARKSVSTTDTTYWKIVYNGATLKFYDNDGFFGEAAASSTVSKIALIGAGYGGYPYLDYVQINNVKVRKYASSEPSSFEGSEQTYGVPYTTGWWDTSWQYRKPITVTDTSGSLLTGYQVNMVIDYIPSKINPDFSDIRFTASDKMTMIPYWVEGYVPSSSATVWVKVPSIPASGSATIYMYYGNPSVASASDGTATFEFFDYFPGNTLDADKWNINAVNHITYTVNNCFQFKDATASGGTYWVYDGASTGSQHQAKWAPLNQFTIEFKSRINDTAASQMGEGMIGLVASDNTVIGAAGHHDWEVAGLFPRRGATTENVPSSLGSGVTAFYPPTFINTVGKGVSATDTTYWKIVYNGATLEFYDATGFFAEATVTSAISKLALIAGAYQLSGVTYLDYVQMNDLRIRKYASSEPSTLMGSEEASETLAAFYYHGSPKQMGGVAETWVWSNFTWNNPTIQEGTTVAWKIWYLDTSGNWNSTGIMTFTVTSQQPTLAMNLADKTCRKYNETFNVQINITDAGNVEDFRFEIHYNATLLDVSGVSWDAWGGGTYVADEVNGILTGCTWGSPISGDATLLTITFNATYHHLWKDESTFPGWKNNQTGIIYCQWANLSYPGSPDLSYVRGGTQNQVNVGQDVTYTFSPIQGDINNDGSVDIFDLRAVATFYKVKIGDPNWGAASAYDLNHDGIIDIFDLVTIAVKLGPP
jgi:hypothetical protein